MFLRIDLQVLLHSYNTPGGGYISESKCIWRIMDGIKRICIGVWGSPFMAQHGTAVVSVLAEWSLNGLGSGLGMHARVVLDTIDCHDCGLAGLVGAMGLQFWL